ncbi:MAG: hypothetical protein M5U19_06820 [Microthrixaceae bacterium]|nr:hypothetical protein [Microthrixaceae bacterium]
MGRTAGELSGMGDEQRRRTRQVEEPVHVAQALESLIELIEEYSSSEPVPSIDQRMLPLSTGRVYLDRLLGGGYGPGP